MINFYPLAKTRVLCTQKNHLKEMVLFIAHNICFGIEIRKFYFNYTLLFGCVPHMN